MHGLDNNHKINLFIQIFLKIFDAKIKFIRTKYHPLLPNQTLMQPNKFKTISHLFLNHFDIKLEINDFLPPLKVNKIYQKDKRRSDKISMLFIESLHKIQSMLMTKKQYKLFSHHVASINNVFIRNDYDFMKYNLNNTSNVNNTSYGDYDMNGLHEIRHNNKYKQSINRTMNNKRLKRVHNFGIKSNSNSKQRSSNINYNYFKQESNNNRNLSNFSRYQSFPQPQKVRLVRHNIERRKISHLNMNMNMNMNRSNSPPSPPALSSSQTHHHIFNDLNINFNLNGSDINNSYHNENISKPIIIDVPGNDNKCKIMYRISFNPLRIEQYPIIHH